MNTVGPANQDRRSGERATQTCRRSGEYFSNNKLQFLYKFLSKWSKDLSTYAYSQEQSPSEDLLPSVSKHLSYSVKRFPDNLPAALFTYVTGPTECSLCYKRIAGEINRYCDFNGTKIYIIQKMYAYGTVF